MDALSIFGVVFIAAVVLFGTHWLVTFAHWVVMNLIHKYRKVNCDCELPKRGMIGDVFVCPECLWKWSMWWDDFWSDWGWMPYYKKIFLKVGLIPEEQIKYLPPPPAIPPTQRQVRAARLAKRMLNHNIKR